METKSTMQIVVREFLDDGASDLAIAIDQHLIDIILKLKTNKLIPRGLYEDIVNGVQGTTQRLHAMQVLLALEHSLVLNPDRTGEFLSILSEYEEGLAKELSLNYKGLCNTMTWKRHSYTKCIHSCRCVNRAIIFNDDAHFTVELYLPST